jgi:hypothetical protein
MYSMDSRFGSCAVVGAAEKTAGRRDALHDGAVKGCASGARGGQDTSSSRQKEDGAEEDDD